VIRTARKDTEKFMAEVNAYAKVTGRKIRWEWGAKHIYVCEIDSTGQPRKVFKEDGFPLGLAGTPGTLSWRNNAEREFRALGLYPPPVIRRSSGRRHVVLPLSDRIGRALRSDLPATTRRGLLRELKELEERATTNQEDIAA
jgi:hypothetical protein